MTKFQQVLGNIKTFSNTDYYKFFAIEKNYQLLSSREVALIGLNIRKKESGFVNKLCRYHVRWMAVEA